MAKAIHLTAYFLTGCIAASALAWVGKYSELASASKLLFFFLFLGWVLCWLLDDALIHYFKVETKFYYSMLIGIGASLIVGGILGCLVFLVQHT